MQLLSDDELKNIVGGVIPGLSSVIAIGAIGILLIAIYKLYQSSKGEVNLGGGIGFEWEVD